MSTFEPSKWKVGQPTLRVAVALSVLGAASFVIGSCSRHRTLPERQEAETRQDIESCTPGSHVSEGTIIYKPNEPDAGFNPNKLCLQHSATIRFTNQGSTGITICFRRQLPDGGSEDVSPFEDGGTSVTVSNGGTKSRKAHGPRDGGVYDGGGVYDFALRRSDGECAWDGGIIQQGNAGTLEVGTGGTTEGTGP